MKRVLVACEYSGRVRDAFAACGWDAWSCDLEESEAAGQHYRGDIREILEDKAKWGTWDLLIGFPPCTYLCGMGIWWNHKRPERWPLTLEAKDFVKYLWSQPISKCAIENPIGYLSNHWQKPTQIIQPWQFGHEANKPTCLWLRGLPKLQATKIVDKGKFYVKSNGARMSAWSHKMSGTNKAARARIASRTFVGIAEAMADQWSKL